MPNVSLFPFDTLEAKIAKPRRWEPTPNDPDPQEDEDEHGLGRKMAAVKAFDSKSDPSATSHMVIPKISAEANIMKKIDLMTALQYGSAEGYPPLRSFVYQFTRDVLHEVPYRDGPNILLTVGATDGFAKATALLVDPWFAETDKLTDRPGMLCEIFAYPAPLNEIKPRGVQVVPVEVDGDGMRVHGQGGLEDVLENWDPSKGKRPSLMYTVT